MAKKKTVNKSQQVRDYVKKHPTAKAKDIAKAVRVQVGLVYAVKAQSKSKTLNGKPGRPAGRPTKVSTSGSSGTSEVLRAAEFVKSCGGLSAARNALDAVEQVAAAVN